MADEYWALGDSPTFWDTDTLGTNLTGITFLLGGATSGTLYNGFKQTTANGKTYLYATYAVGDNVTYIGGTAAGSFSFTHPFYRAITVRSIDSGSPAYDWLKSATGGKGVKYDFMQKLSELNSTEYGKLSTSSDCTTKITAKANGYAPNSNTATWQK
mgnify:CR=1 FL=1|nr:MAG TPA: hypothetical protein [Caudoviricetes sp.]